MRGEGKRMEINLHDDGTNAPPRRHFLKRMVND
jgi:hypothetical protein